MSKQQICLEHAIRDYLVRKGMSEPLAEAEAKRMVAPVPHGWACAETDVPDHGRGEFG